MQKGRQWFEIGILLMEIVWGKRTAESEREREGRGFLVSSA